MKNYDMYTYCCMRDEDLKGEYKNEVVKLESEELEEWKKRYKKGFVESYLDINNESLDVRRCYCDPDSTYQKGYNHHFFDMLEKFLSIRERELSEKLQGNFQYEFVENEGIKISGADEKGKEIRPFFIRSDQFGFSAPTNKKIHPYDLYISKTQNKDEAIEQVVKWIIISRTIGGSFLWPRPFYDSYNIARGGTINSNRKYYIQDRVDLTLWEIYYYYKKINSNTIMNRCSKGKNSLKIWLNHFNDFDTYVNFFCFDENFVKKIEDEIKPINILKEDVEEPIWVDNKNPQIEISTKLDEKEVFGMLKKLNELIEKRSNKMLDFIK